MKRKKLITLLLSLIMIMSMILAGCGTEEVVSSEPAIPEEPTSVEVSEEISEEESIEESSMEPNYDVVIEVDPEFMTRKEEIFPVGTTVDTDFGSVTRLGDNEMYPNALEDLEINFQGKVIQMSLPKDMCGRITWNLETNELHIFNEDESKRMYMQFIETYSEKDISDTTYTIEYLTGFLNAAWSIEVDTNNELLISEENNINRYEINATRGDYIGKLVYYVIPDTNPTEELQSDGTAKTIYYPENLVFCYGETSIVDNNEYMNTISSSIQVIVGEDSAIIENEQIKEDLTIYGIPEGVTLPESATLDSDNSGYTTIFIPLNNKEDCITLLDDINASTPVTERMGYLDSFSGEAAMAVVDEYMEVNCEFDYNGKHYWLIVRPYYEQLSYTIAINLVE